MHTQDDMQKLKEAISKYHLLQSNKLTILAGNPPIVEAMQVALDLGGGYQRCRTTTAKTAIARPRHTKNLPGAVQFLAEHKAKIGIWNNRKKKQARLDSSDHRRRTPLRQTSSLRSSPWRRFIRSLEKPRACRSRARSGPRSKGIRRWTGQKVVSQGADQNPWWKRNFSPNGPRCSCPTPVAQLLLEGARGRGNLGPGTRQSLYRHVSQTPSAACILGYADPDVDAAVHAAVDCGSMGDPELP